MGKKASLGKMEKAMIMLLLALIVLSIAFIAFFGRDTLGTEVISEFTVSVDDGKLENIEVIEVRDVGACILGGRGDVQSSGEDVSYEVYYRTFDDVDEGLDFSNQALLLSEGENIVVFVGCVPKETSSLFVSVQEIADLSNHISKLESISR